MRTAIIILASVTIGIVIGFAVAKANIIPFPVEPPTGQGPFQKGSCTYYGVTYKDGEGFKDVDNCNSCSCSNGQVMCTTMACE